MEIVEVFLHKFFTVPGKLALGINPGRLGAGITGVNFTAPRQLREACGIEHPLGNTTELSAAFIYEMIDRYGGAKTFYRNWFIGSVCPLGFVKAGKNINYYDDKDLQVAVTPFITESISKQVAMGFDTTACICIGGEKNFRCLSALNLEYRWFTSIIPLPHPRFIMQYRVKQKENFLRQYLAAFGAP